VDERGFPAHNRNAALNASAARRNYREERQMDFIRNMQPKDWMVAAVAFIAGAIIF